MITSLLPKKWIAFIFSFFQLFLVINELSAQCIPVDITTSPTSTVGCEGETIIFTIITTGTVTGYQWKKGANPIPNQNSASLTLSNLTLNDAATYSVEVTGPCGNDIVGIVLAVTAKPIITTQPIGATKCAGETQTFSVVATNAGSYQWKKDDSDLDGEISSTLTLSALCSSCDAGNYSVIVNGIGACATQSVNSNSVGLTVNDPVDITSGSELNPARCEGESITFSITTTGNVTGYQWKKNGTSIPSGTGSSFTLSSLTPNDAATYSVDVSGSCGNDSYGGIVLGINSKPIITTQPIGATKCAGETQTFSVVATNAGSYQWKKDDSDLDGEISSTLTLSALCSSCDAGNYSVIVNGIGACATQSVNSNSVGLTVNDPVDITSGSELNPARCEGESITFSITTTGNVTGYQWKKNGTSIPSGTGSSFTLSSLTPNDAATYSVDVSGSCGNDSYGGIVLGINSKPIITTQPIGATKCAGETQTFSVVATNAGSYQWKKDDSDLDGEISSTLTLSALCSSCDAGNYSVIVNGIGACATQSVNSNSVGLIVNETIQINSVTSDKEICEYGNTSFEVIATGTIIGYQWFKDNQIISGANSSVFNLTNALADQTGQYHVEIFGPCGNKESQKINLRVFRATKPIIIPSGPTTFCEGNNVNLAVNNCSGSVTWSDNQKTNSIVVSTPSVYHVTCTINGCVSDRGEEAKVIVHPIPNAPIISGVGDFCTTTSITANGCNGVVTWNNGFEGNTLFVASSGTFTATCAENNCISPASSPAVVNITILPTPTITSNKASILCINESFTLTASNCPSNSLVNWYRNGDLVANGITYTSEITGKYEAKCTANNCISEASNTIEQSNISKITFEKEQKNVSCFGLSDAIIIIKPSGGFGEPYTVNWGESN